MTRIYDTFLAGGLVMWPLLSLSIVTLACALERVWFWCNLVIREKRLVREVLATAEIDLEKAEAIAERANHLAIGRFLLEPLKLKNSSPEIFHLAVKAASDKECVEIRRGNRLLESVIAIAPLLGIIGTATGLITAFTNLKTGTTDFFLVTAGIGQALISSATGITIAVVAFIFFRIFVILQLQQIDFFSKVGNELELIYLQHWSNQQLTVSSGHLKLNSNHSGNDK
ncbi:MotA/TolQ/ExbB proton channel family protein [Scytonema sp. NUACC21]